MTAIPPSIHEGVSCDGCHRSNFTGQRFKCLRCYDFDLCENCFLNKQYVDSNDPQAPAHTSDHPMQLMLTHHDFEETYADDPSRNYDACKIVTFTCPYCNEVGFNMRGFVTHVLSHPYQIPSDLHVLCPLCIAYPEFDSNRDVADLKVHINQMHNQPDSAPYRSEPITRQTARRPMLARRTQRQPAGQAGTFATGGVGINAPMGWATEMGDVDEMFRLVNLTRVPTNMQALTTNMGMPPATGTGMGGPGTGIGLTMANPMELQRLGALGQSVFQQMQQDTMVLRDRVAPPSGYAAAVRSNLPRGMSEYAQPRHTTTATASATVRPAHSSAAPIAPVVRVVRVAPIYPSTIKSYYDDPEALSEMSDSDDDAESDDNDNVDNDDDDEEDDDDEQVEDVLDVDDVSNLNIPAASSTPAAEIGENDNGPAMAIDAGTSTTSLSQPSTTNEVAGTQRRRNDSEFEFDDPSSDEEITDGILGETDVPTTVTSGEQSSSVVQPIEPEVPVSKDDILRVLRKNLTRQELTSLSHILKQDCTSDSDMEDSLDSDNTCRGVGGGGEDGPDQQNWAALQFDVPPLSTFGMGDYWNDKRFLRQRKLHREVSMATNVEDTLLKTDVALAMMRAAAPSTSQADIRPYDSVERSLRLALRSETLSMANGSSDSAAEPTTSAAPTREDMLVEVSRRLESESERSQPTPSPPDASSASSAPMDYIGVDSQDLPEPISDGESSDDEDERSIRQDDVEFLADTELRQ